jgi:hypothetical protein
MRRLWRIDRARVALASIAVREIGCPCDTEAVHRYLRRMQCRLPRPIVEDSLRVAAALGIIDASPDGASVMWSASSPPHHRVHSSVS